MDTWLIAALGLLFSVFCTAVATTWQVSKMMDRRDMLLTKMMTDHEAADTLRFANVFEAIRASASVLAQQFGDTGRALREALHKIELDMQKTRTSNLEDFVRRDSFFNVVNGQNGRFEKIDEKFDKADNKIDEVIRFVREEILRRDDVPRHHNKA